MCSLMYPKVKVLKLKFQVSALSKKKIKQFFLHPWWAWGQGVKQCLLFTLCTGTGSLTGGKTPSAKTMKKPEAHSGGQRSRLEKQESWI